MVTVQVDNTELKKALRKLQGLNITKAERKKVLRKGATLIRDAARENVPVSDEPHFRYKTSKLDGGKRAPKGKGEKVAVYFPGNLRGGIRVKNLSRSPDLFVGAVTGKSGFHGESNPDAYYAAMLEYGTPHIQPVGFMRRAVAGKGAAAAAQIVKDAQKLYAKKVAQLAAR